MENKKLPTLEEIEAIVPKRCFQKSSLLSFRYLAMDLCYIYGIYCILPFVESNFGVFGLFIWYWVVGLFLFALFVVGHDCGHTTFSNYKWLNDLVGHFAHGVLMIPYYPWTKTHRLHHIYTQCLGRDKSHSWLTQEEYEKRNWLLKHFTKVPFIGLILHNPIYLLLGFPDGSHVWPWSKLFTNTRERVECAVSTVVCILFAFLIFSCFCDYNAYNFFKYYALPVMFQGYWLIMVTYLQHRDENSEVYEHRISWSFVRGQLQTIDTVYGLGIDSIVHNVTDGHVAHHLFFTRIPHYHLAEATRAIRHLLENKYPGTYKKTDGYKYWFVFKYQWMLLKLNYLLGKGTGLLKYRTGSKSAGKE